MFSVKESKKELEKLIKLEGLFPEYRLVDPGTHAIYKFENGHLVMPDPPQVCFSLWNRASPCQNCISRRVCEENRQFVKIECLGNDVLLVISTPVKVDGVAYALEIATNITDSAVVADSFHTDNAEITDLIAKINDIAVRDSYTKLYNRNFIMNSLKYLIKNHDSSDFTYAMFSVNDFSAINGKYGHLAGDRIIKRVADVLSKISEQVACDVGRLCGTEFGLIFRSCDFETANRICNYAVREIESFRFNENGEIFGVSVSFGIDKYEDGETYDEFFNRIDRKMIECKSK